MQSLKLTFLVLSAITLSAAAGCNSGNWTTKTSVTVKRNGQENTTNRESSRRELGNGQVETKSKTTEIKRDLEGKTIAVNEKESAELKAADGTVVKSSSSETAKEPRSLVEADQAAH